MTERLGAQSTEDRERPAFIRRNASINHIGRHRRVRSPGIKIKEKKYVLRGFAIGSGLFMTGVLFCYFFLMPMALRASFQYSEWLGFAADEWRAEEYISFVCKFMLGHGTRF